MYRLYRKMIIFLYNLHIFVGYDTVVQLTQFLLWTQQCVKKRNHFDNSEITLCIEIGRLEQTV